MCVSLYQSEMTYARVFFVSFTAFQDMQHQEAKADAVSLSIILLSCTDKNQCPCACAWGSHERNQELVS